MASRRQARELALRVLFALDPSGAGAAAAVARAAAEMGVDERGRRFALELVLGVVRDRAAIDGRLAAASDHWALDQMAQVERTILRMAAFEMGEDGPTPVRVAINEAVDLAKAYGGAEAGRFVNGVLGRLAAPLPLRGAGEVGDEGPPGR